MSASKCRICGGPLDAGGYCIDLYDGLEMLKAAIEYLKPPVMRVPEGYEGLWLILFGYSPAASQFEQDVDRAINEDTLADEISEYLKAGQ